MAKDKASIPITIDFTVNGQAIHTTVPDNMLLVRFLRDELRLTGTKNGCTSGHCGACTIILNGKNTRSCLVKMSKVAGADILTIEGLAQNGQLHPIQHAFIQTGAMQCGFCTAGMILSTKALLDQNPEPNLDEVKTYLARNNNICRCTGYMDIFRAVQLASRWMTGKEPWPEPVSAETIGLPRRYENAQRIVTGRLFYGDDLYPEGVLHGKILWAAHPHANILSIDTSEAEQVPGVAAVLTARDVLGKNQCGIVFRDMPAFADKKVIFIGDPVASVFAETPEIAEAALGKIRVEYEVLPGVFSPQEAAQPDAPQIKEKGNLCHKSAIVRGNVEEAFAKCDVVIEDDYSTPFVEHGFMEPESGVAFINEEGILVVQLPTQSVFDDRAQLVDILNLPEEKIRVIQLPTGGAFGGKEDPILLQHLALGAWKTKRPVKMVLTREESLRVHVKRHPSWIHYKTGCTKDGKVQALQARVTLDTGAYISLGIDVLENTVVFGAGPYYIPNLDIYGESWYTNNVPAGAMRGFGVNQVAIALEQQMDAMARAIGMDTFQFRLINALDVGLPSASDHVMEKGVVSIKETIEACEKAFRKLIIPAAAPGKKIGWGVASAVKNIGFGHGIHESAGAIVEMDCNGKVKVRHSHHEYGQGAQVGLIKLVVNELGTAPEDIVMIGPDTALTPPTGPTTASRQTFLTGNALVMAARALKDEITNRAGDEMGEPPGELEIRGDCVVHLPTGKKMQLSQIGPHFMAERTYAPPTSVQMHEVGIRSKMGKPDFETMPTHVCYAYNTQAAIVEVDEQTGEVKVLTIVAVVDVGKLLNYDAVVGQINGGVMMGLGMALSEQFLVEKGINLTDSLHKVRLPGPDKTPEIIPVIVEVPHPYGPEGVKGFAEAPSLATAPAILNAIYDAIGVRIKTTPADKRCVLASLKERSGGGRKR
ncbi:MAG: molybdopterin-dependent oxidoreductase [Chloroflexi bacterium]|nr:molybdopterin-dependent oxidoreductase [Chloroflexota bacterium]